MRLIMLLIKIILAITYTVKGVAFLGGMYYPTETEMAFMMFLSAIAFLTFSYYDIERIKGKIEGET